MSECVIAGTLSGKKVRLGRSAVEELYEQGCFGRPAKRGLELTLVEAAYLLDREQIEVRYGGDDLDFRTFFELCSGLESGFEFRYVVYKDLRERGYYVQPGITDFEGLPPGRPSRQDPCRVLRPRDIGEAAALFERYPGAGQGRPPDEKRG
jgi:tRNA splicing endonuclease